MRLQLAFVACLLACSCKQKTADANDAGAITVHAASPVENTPEHHESGRAPTDKPSQDSKDAAATLDAGALTVDAGAALVAKAEVEIVGAIEGAPAGATLFVTVSKTDCKPNEESLDVYGVQMVPTPKNYFIEVFAEQGSTGWLCAYAVQGGNVVAFGAGAKNPMTMKGEGEVMFPGSNVTLKKTSPGWKAPPQLQ